MNKLLTAICSFLGLDPASTSEDQALTALAARQSDDPLAALRAALGVDASADSAALVAACTALKSNAPDPARFIGIDAFNQVKTQLAALTAQVEGDKVEELVAAALGDGRLLAAQEAWARSLGKSDFASLKAYVESATPIAALRTTQTGGKAPVDEQTNPLNAEEMVVCRAVGIDPKDFAAARAELAAA